MTKTLPSLPAARGLRMRSRNLLTRLQVAIQASTTPTRMLAAVAMIVVASTAERRGKYIAISSPSHSLN